MSFTLLKQIHASCAGISIILFFLRGIWSFNGSPIMRQGWVKVIPHIVDTILLASALGLAYTIGQYPFIDSWLTAKFFGLVLFILLGSIALKHGKSKSIRVAAWFAAMAVFAYIVAVAANHDPLPFIR